MNCNILDLENVVTDLNGEIVKLEKKLFESVVEENCKKIAY